MTCVWAPRRLPVVPVCIGVLLCIGDRECAHARSGCKCQYCWAYVPPSSFHCGACPSCVRCAAHPNSHHSQRRPTRTTDRIADHKSSVRPKSSRRASSMTGNSHPYCSQRSSLAEERHQARSGKMADNWLISHSGLFRTFMPLEELHSHPRAGSRTSSASDGSRAPSTSLRTRTT